jgi:hypothetical protein
VLPRPHRSFMLIVQTMLAARPAPINGLCRDQSGCAGLGGLTGPRSA